MSRSRQSDNYGAWLIEAGITALMLWFGYKIYQAAKEETWQLPIPK